MAKGEKTNNMKPLSKRLQQIVDLVPNHATIADVGCDHGKVLQYAVLHLNPVFVYGSDISKSSVNKTTNLLQNMKCSNFKTLQSDGLQAYSNAEKRCITTIVIAGMGGREIVSILSKLLQEKEQYENLKTLVLQPQNNVEFLREFLQNSKFNIMFDKKLKDKHMFYDVLQVQPFCEKGQNLTEDQLLFGKTNLQTYNDDFVLFLNLQLKQINKILSKAKQEDVKKQQLKLQDKLLKLLQNLQQK